MSRQNVTNDPIRALVRWLTARPDGLHAAHVVINEINRGELEILLPRLSVDPASYALYKKIAATEGTGRDQLADGLFC
ncbi:hypothetical protein ACLB1R_23145 [Escherichia coli]